MVEIKIYGKLEDILEGTHPTRNQIFYLLGTLSTKHSAEEIIEFVNKKSSWCNYDSEQVEKMVYWIFKKTTQKRSFFSSCKRRDDQTKEQIHKPKIWKFNKGYVRTVTKNEIALDLDTHKDFDYAVRIFKRWNLKGNCRTWQGAKGGHMSLFFDKLPSLEFKESIRLFFNGDLGQVNISVENKLHQKTGNQVHIIAENKGLSAIEDLEKVLKEEK